MLNDVMLMVNLSVYFLFLFPFPSVKLLYVVGRNCSKICTLLDSLNR